MSLPNSQTRCYATTESIGLYGKRKEIPKLGQMADIKIDAAIQPAVRVSTVEVGISGGGRPKVWSGVAWLGSAKALRAAGSWLIGTFHKKHY